MKVEIRGNWSSILTYIDKVSHLPYALTIQNLDLRTTDTLTEISAGKKTAGGQQWVANFEIVVKKIQ